MFRSQGADARRGGRVISAPAAVRRMTGVHSAFKVAGHIEVAAGYRGNPHFCGVARKRPGTHWPRFKPSTPGIGLAAAEGDGRSAGGMFETCRTIQLGSRSSQRRCRLRPRPARIRARLQTSAHLRFGPPRLAQLQAPVHELPIDREELRRPLTPDVGDSTCRSPPHHRRLDYRELIPAPRLRRYIQCYWTLRAPAAEASPAQRVLPDGCVEIIVNLGDQFIRHDAAGQAERQPIALVVGPTTRHMSIAPTGVIQSRRNSLRSRRCAAISLRFAAGAS